MRGKERRCDDNDSDLHLLRLQISYRRPQQVYQLSILCHDHFLSLGRQSINPAHQSVCPFAEERIREHTQRAAIAPRSIKQEGKRRKGAAELERSVGECDWGIDERGFEEIVFVDVRLLDDEEERRGGRELS